MTQDQSWLQNRAEAEVRAARLVEEYEGPVMRMVAQAIRNELAEALDRPLFYFVALAAIGVWRGLQRKERNRAKRMARLEVLLSDHGPALSSRRRKMAERRLRRLRSLSAEGA